MLVVKIILIVGVFGSLVNTQCSPLVSCVTSDSPETCLERGLRYAENVRFNNCCPGCVPKKDPNEPCEPNDLCAPGYFCSADTNKCEPDNDQVCEIKHQSSKPGEWLPECSPDGTYAPKQCKGEPMSGRCFCFDPMGNRIFGEADWNEADDMTCACSRFVWSQNRSDVSLHCNDKGNYEDLQCDRGVCWCADEKTGTPLSAVVPEKMIKSLQCYDFSRHADQYLRKCDSIKLSSDYAQKLMSTHGTNNVYFTPVACNYDGSYYRVQIVANKKICVSKTGSKLTEWTTDIADDTMNCNCEYDRSIVGDSFIYECDLNGNYIRHQNGGGGTFCVDSDGFNTPC